MTRPLGPGTNCTVRVRDAAGQLLRTTTRSLTEGAGTASAFIDLRSFHNQPVAYGATLRPGGRSLASDESFEQAGREPQADRKDDRRDDGSDSSWLPRPGRELVHQVAFGDQSREGGVEFARLGEIATID